MLKFSQNKKERGIQLTKKKFKKNSGKENKIKNKIEQSEARFRLLHPAVDGHTL